MKKLKINLKMILLLIVVMFVVYLVMGLTSSHIVYWLCASYTIIYIPYNLYRRRKNKLKKKQKKSVFKWFAFFGLLSLIDIILTSVWLNENTLNNEINKLLVLLYGLFGAFSFVLQYILALILIYVFLVYLEKNFEGRAGHYFFIGVYGVVFILHLVMIL